MKVCSGREEGKFMGGEGVRDERWEEWGFQTVRRGSRLGQ